LKSKYFTFALKEVSNLNNEWNNWITKKCYPSCVDIFSELEEINSKNDWSIVYDFDVIDAIQQLMKRE
jgi:hypothetical protein